MNVVLIGYRGTGKTHVAGLLSEILRRQAISLDQEIVRTAGLGIPEIVERFGWDGFRDLEAEVVRKICTRDDLIIDAGGGVVLREENVRNLRRSGFVVLLLADKEAIVGRISGGTDRPSLTGKKSFTDEVEEVLNERMPKYLAAADFQIDTTDLPPDHVAREIVRELRARKMIGAD